MFEQSGKKRIWTYMVLVSVVFTAACIIIASEDEEKELRCSVCGKVIKGEYFTSGGKVYCSKKCWKKSRPRCAVCGKKIYTGGYYRYKGKHVCSQKCLDKLRPKCAVCGKTVKEDTGIKSNGKYYCSEKCFKKGLPACFVCGARITHMYKVKGHVYCKKCFNTPKCLQCGCPTGGELLPDGRPFCRECKKMGIIKRETALGIFREVKKLLKDEFSIETDPDIEFHFVNKPVLEKVSKKKEIREDGLYRKLTVETATDIGIFGVKIAEGFNKKQTTLRQVYVLTWLDKPHLRQVCAHELMHDWTETHFHDIDEIEVIEGISEYAAYLCNRYYGYSDLNTLKMKNKDPVYGAGFRLVLSADKGKGIQDITQWLKSGEYLKDLKKLKKKAGEK